MTARRNRPAVKASRKASAAVAATAAGDYKVDSGGRKRRGSARTLLGRVVALIGTPCVAAVRNARLRWRAWMERRGRALARKDRTRRRAPGPAAPAVE